MTSPNGNISALMAICAGNPPVPGEFPAQRPVTRSFYVFFDLRLNKGLSKQSWGWWFETPSCPLWRHHNDAELGCFLCCQPEQTFAQTINSSTIWEAIIYVWRRYCAQAWASLSVLRNVTKIIYSNLFCWAITFNCWSLGSDSSD